MIHIVLVEPEIPQNTGNIARTCAVTGAKLHLVGPLGFAIDDRKLKRAGLDYWDELCVQHYSSLSEFLERHKGKEPCFYFTTTKGLRTYSDVSYPEEVFFFFGKETAGLPVWLLQEYPDRCVRLPMRDHLRSLNLSNTVAVFVYEALRQKNFPNLNQKGAFPG